MVFDRQGLCLFANSTGLSMMELDDASVKGKPFRNIWPDDQRSIIDSHVQKTLEGESCAFELYWMRGSHKTWWRVSLSPLCNDNGEVEAFLAINTDVTVSREAEENVKRLNKHLEQEIENRTRALRQAHEELLVSKKGLQLTEAELHTTIENLPFEFFGIDRTGAYFIQNRVCRNNWGNLIGKKPQDISPDRETLNFWLDNNRRALAGEIVREEFEYAKEGERRYAYNILAPISVEGSIEGVVGFNIDVTELVRADTERRLEAKKFRNLFESVSDAIIIIDMAGNFIDFNRTAYERLGFTREEMHSMTIARVDHPDFAVKIPERMQELRDRGAAFFESAHRKKDGTTIPVEVNAKVIEYEGRQVILSVIRDITERKRAEEALINSEKKFRNLLGSLQEGIWAIDAQDNTTFVNPRMAGMLGYTEAEMLGKSVFSFMDERGVEICRENIQQRKAGVKEQHDFELLRNDGKRIYVTMYAAPIFDESGNYSGGIAGVIDITDRRRAEAALRESEEKFRAIVQTTTEWIWESDAGGIHIFSNAAVERILGYRADEIIDKNAFDLICKDDQAKVTDILVRDRVEKKGWAGLVLRWRHRDGSLRYLESNAMPILDARGVVSGYRGSDRDITERMKAAAALEDSERKYRSIIESTDTGFVILDARGRVLDANREYARLSGHNTVAEVLGRAVTEWTAAHDLERNKAEVKKCVRQGFVRNLEIDYVDRDGKITPIEISATTIETSGGITIFSLCRDISERRRAEAELRQYRDRLEELVEERTRQLTVLNEQLRQSQKLEAVGLLAGGIAHDFSNILAAIKGSMYLIQKKLQKDATVMQYVDQVVSSISRANNLTQGLLAFGRQQMVVLKPRDINRLVSEMATLVSQVIGEDITLRLMLSDKGPKALADKNQIEQVLLNLVTNARDAMPDGGKLAIRTDIIEMDDSFRKEHGYGVSGRYVLIAVSDTGTGIKEEIREKIFEPFFTTKDAGKGSGLGLAVSYGIIKQHNGYIGAESSQDRGTTFRVYIPAVEAEVTQPEARSESPAAPGRETILFAEDDADARATTAEILRMTGYEVLEAKDGEEALRMFGEHKDRIRLALLDVRMPGKNGREVYEAIRDSGSETRFLFISGYTADIMDEAVVREKNVDFISKITSPDEILKKIREILDK